MCRITQKLAAGEGFDSDVTVGLRGVCASYLITATMNAAVNQQSWATVRSIAEWLHAHAPSQDCQDNANQDFGYTSKQPSTIVFNKPDSLVHIMYSAAKVSSHVIACPSKTTTHNHVVNI